MWFGNSALHANSALWLMTVSLDLANDVASGLLYKHISGHCSRDIYTNEANFRNYVRFISEKARKRDLLAIRFDQRYRETVSIKAAWKFSSLQTGTYLQGVMS